MKIHSIEGGGGLKLHVREWGDPATPAIFLIHGWSQSHMCWKEQYDSELANSFRLVAMDLRGHGMSEAPVTPDAYNDSAIWANDVAAVIEKLNLDRPILAGWSYGGLVIGDYLNVHGQDKIGGINYAGAACMLNETALGSIIGPGFLIKAIKPFFLNLGIPVRQEFPFGDNSCSAVIRASSFFSRTFFHLPI